MNQTRKRLLYVEAARGRGGSVNSLFELITNIDKSRYDPLVLFHHPNKFRDRFREAGIRTLVMSHPCGPSSPHDKPTSAKRLTIAEESKLRDTQLASGYRSFRHVFRLGKCDLPLALSLARLIKNENVDLVHNNNTPFGNRASIMGARLAGIPQVSHVRRLTEYSRTEHMMTRLPDKIIFISRACEDNYQKFGVDRSRSVVITNPIDVCLFKKSWSTSGLRQELGLAETDFVISNIARLDAWKGHEYFLQALAPVVRENPGVKALLVGEIGTEKRNVRYHELLHQLVGDLELESNVIFTGHRDDIPQIMALSNIVVHSASEPEPFGRVIVEAMAAGRPVIATAAGGPLEIVENGETGLLVPPGDARAMSEAIFWIIHNQDEARLMAESARQRAAARYTRDRHIDAVQDLYETLMNG